MSPFFPLCVFIGMCAVVWMFLPVHEQNSDERDRRVYVGGLPSGTTVSKLRAFYEQFGDIEECVVLIDPFTQRLKRFGIVTYKTSSSIDAALENWPHVVDGKEVEMMFTPDVLESSKADSSVSEAVRTVYVQGISQETNEDNLRDYFKRYGQIENVLLMMDRKTGKNRGSAFIVFQFPEEADHCCSDAVHIINGRQFVVKRALSRNDKRMSDRPPSPVRRSSRERDYLPPPPSLGLSRYAAAYDRTFYPLVPYGRSGSPGRESYHAYASSGCRRNPRRQAATGSCFWKQWCCIHRFIYIPVLAGSIIFILFEIPKAMLKYSHSKTFKKSLKYKSHKLKDPVVKKSAPLSDFHVAVSTDEYFDDSLQQRVEKPVHSISESTSTSLLDPIMPSPSDSVPSANVNDSLQKPVEKPAYSLFEATSISKQLDPMPSLSLSTCKLPENILPAGDVRAPADVQREEASDSIQQPTRGPDTVKGVRTRSRVKANGIILPSMAALCRQLKR